MSSDDYTKGCIAYTNALKQDKQTGYTDKVADLYRKARRHLQMGSKTLSPSSYDFKQCNRLILAIRARVSATDESDDEDGKYDSVKTVDEIPDDWQGEDNIAATQAIKASIVPPGKARWNDLAGMDAVQDAFKTQFILPKTAPERFKLGKETMRRGILLYGPPGTGKTEAVHAAVNEIIDVFGRCTYMEITPSKLTSKWQSGTERATRMMFDIARKMPKPVVIFIDEGDSLFKSRTSGVSAQGATAMSEFLTTTSRNKNKHMILFVMATNIPTAFDTAVIRRLGGGIYVRLPNKQERVLIIASWVRQLGGIFLTSGDAVTIASQTDMFSGADFSTLFSTAQSAVALREQTAYEKKKMRITTWDRSDPPDGKIYIAAADDGDTIVSPDDYDRVIPLQPVVMLDDVLALLRGRGRVKPTSKRANLLEYEKFEGADAGDDDDDDNNDVES